jgi:hypothetical protein
MLDLVHIDFIRVCQLVMAFPLEIRHFEDFPIRSLLSDDVAPQYNREGALIYTRAKQCFGGREQFSKPLLIVILCCSKV